MNNVVKAKIDADISQITIVNEISLERINNADEQRAKLQKEIARLEKQARAEKQPKKKFELVQEIKRLKNNFTR